MRVVFRTDASSTIGTGHVMRCLTLANVLREGANVSFICREHDGHLIHLIEECGYSVSRLSTHSNVIDTEGALPHAAWLGAKWQNDAEASRDAIEALGGKADWLVVDHYAIDQRWEEAMRKVAKRIMVIDDLADRMHDCEILLDQNLVAEMHARYIDKVSPACDLLLGPEYALLQHLYADMHDSMPPRSGLLKRIFIYFGGADGDNQTGRALAAVLKLNRPDIEVDVVLPADGQHSGALNQLLEGRANIKMHSRLPTLAPLMVGADLSIGAGGATTWERLCLGLPSLVITLAENQRSVAACLDKRGLIQWLGHKDQVNQQSIVSAVARIMDTCSLGEWSHRCLQVCDGRGASRVRERIFARS